MGGPILFAHRKKVSLRNMLIRYHLHNQLVFLSLNVFQTIFKKKKIVPT